MSVASLINDKGVLATVRRASFTTDDSGHPTPTYTTQGQILVFLQPRSGNETVRYGRDNSETLAISYVKRNADVKSGDILLVGTDVWRVENVRIPGTFSSAEFTAHKTLTMTWREGE